MAPAILLQEPPSAPWQSLKTAPTESNGSTFRNDSKFDAMLMIEPPSDSGHRWWWYRCAPLLASLLKSSESYTHEQQADHLRVFRDAVVPTFGPPTPQAFTKPLLTMDGSPFEASWNFTKKGSVVRYTFEPLGDLAGTAADPFAGAVVPSLIPLMKYLSAESDMRWFEQIMNQWLVTSATDVANARAALPKQVQRVPQIFLAFDMKGSDRMLKAYFFPVLKHFATGETTEKLAFDMIRNLQPGGDKLKSAADKLQNYLANCQEPCPVEMVAIDCIDPTKARVKVYARTKSNSKKVLRDACTLGGAQKDELTMQGLETVEKVWHLLLDERGGMTPEQTKPPRDPNTLHQGVCFVFELKQGADRIDVKAHMPWNQTSESDLRTIGNFTEALGALGWASSAAKYARGAIETALIPGKDYSQPGALSYVSYNYSEKGPYMSSYFSPKAQE